MIDLTKNNQLKKDKQVFFCKNCGRILADPNSDRCLTCGVKIDKDGQIRKFITDRHLTIVEFNGLDVIDYGGILEV